MLRLFFFLPFFIFLSDSGFTGEEPSRCRHTDGGPAIEWTPEIKLAWTDFKSTNKVSRGFSIAASTCGFGYDGLVQGNEIKVNVYVRFYCKESWRNPDFDMTDVLEHEQLHFDICELYGRKFYKEIVKLRNENKLTERSLNIMYNDLVEEYDQTQNKYDRETNHSTETEEQHKWNKFVKAEIDKLQEYSNYREF